MFQCKMYSQIFEIYPFRVLWIFSKKVIAQVEVTLFRLETGTNILEHELIVINILT